MRDRITLHDILRILPKDTYVGIWDCRHVDSERKKGFEIHPTQQKYIKIKNLPYERVRYLLDEEVSKVCHTEKGIFIQVMESRENVRMSINNFDLANKIASRLRVDGGY